MLLRENREGKQRTGGEGCIWTASLVTVAYEKTSGAAGG